ncbi:MAG TPA: nuclear transport factor 2 family protein [Streptosporangiaceae bacterium]|nr:nuclear transport factor 2 family protein [Streptosporangiaceae bacterium]
MSKDVLERVYREVSNGNAQPLLDSLAEDITWTIIGSTPLSGVYHGKDEVTSGLLAGVRARLATPLRFTIDRFIAEGEYVVMQARGHSTTVDGLAYDNTYCIIARIVDGRILELTDYIDTELITSALYGASV